MTEAEAVAIVREQLVTERGFIARLQRGEGIDHEAVRQVYGALEALAGYWADRACVPKDAVLPMVDVFTPIFACIPLYPDRKIEIQRLAIELVDRVESVFWGPNPSMTEEEAMALVYGHLNGLPSLAFDLHHRERPKDDTLEQLHAALQTLERAWAGRACVPKTIVGPMLDVRELIAGHAGWWPEVQPRLVAIADDLKESVKRCLS